MKWRSIFLGFLLTALITGLVKYLLTSNQFNITVISWQHPKTSSTEYYKVIQHQLDEKVAFVKDRPIWAVSVHEIESALQALPWLKSAYVTRRFPNELHIKLEYKKISALIMGSSGTFMPIAEDSTLLTPAKITQAPSVPLLVNEEFLKNEDLRKSAVSVISKLPEYGYLSQDTVSEISWIGGRNFSFALKGALPKIKLGSENSEIKISRVNKVLNYLDQNQIKSRVIDANFSKKVVVKLRNHD